MTTLAPIDRPHDFDRSIPSTPSPFLCQEVGRVMRTPGKRALTITLLVVAPVGAVPVTIWVSLTHRPQFYRAMVQVPREQQEAKARRFVAQSLQRRNDIINEPTWEAIFTDQEVNAWLAKDLVT